MSHLLNTAVILGVVLHLVSCASGPFQSYVVEDVGRAEEHLPLYRVEYVGGQFGENPPGFQRATGINDAGDVITNSVRKVPVVPPRWSFRGWVFVDDDAYSWPLFAPLSDDPQYLNADGINNIPFRPGEVDPIFPFAATGGWSDDDEPDPGDARHTRAIITQNNAIGPPPYELGALRGGRFSGGKDINDALQVTGWSERCWVGFCAVHAFLWSRTGGMRDLGTLGGNISEGAAINASGQIAGFSTTASSKWRAFRYTPGVGMVSLGTLSLGDSSRAHGINDQGHVVGESETRPGFAPLGPLPSTDLSPTAPLTANYAFLWTEGAGMRSLGSLGGDSVATAINNHNVVVGYSALTAGRASPHSGHPFRWTAEGGMIDLNDLLPSGSGWELLNAYDINDKGQIVGSGRIDGQIRAYRLSRAPVVVVP